MSLVLARQYTNIAGWALLIYDQIITWDREVDSIWRSSDWALKAMFFLGRYGALAIQTVNTVYTHPYMLEKQVMSCHSWFGFQTITMTVLLVNLQLILMLRVHALYERSKKIACFLISWFLFYSTILGIMGHKLAHSFKLDSSCMMEEAPNAKLTISLSAMCMLDQCILWGLTANKYRDAIRRGWSTSPIMRLVMRDTSWSCLAICCVFIAVIPYVLMAQDVGHIIYCLLCSLVSVFTCRMILNMRGLWNSDDSLSIDITTMDLEPTDMASAYGRPHDGYPGSVSG